MDGLENFYSPSSRQICQTCGKPDMSLRHRQKCLQKSEKEIYKQLQKNKREEVGESTPLWVVLFIILGVVAVITAFVCLFIDQAVLGIVAFACFYGWLYLMFRIFPPARRKFK